jgi:hypothetical protein
MPVRCVLLAGLLVLIGACGEQSDGDRVNTGSSLSIASGDAPVVPNSSNPRVETVESSTGDIELDVVSVHPASPAPGEVIEIVINARASGLLHQQVVSFGDGRSIQLDLGTGCDSWGDYSEPPPPPVGPTEELGTITTTYAAPGEYSVSIEVEAYAECSQQGQGTGTQMGRLTVPVSVTDGPVVGNGDMPPSATLTESIGWGGTDVRVEATGTDNDGWISELRIDWGDGSTPTTIIRNEACAPGPGGWPMNPSYTEAATHTYPASGEYTARLTVISTACDGTQMQTASGSNNVVFPSR